MIVENDDKEDFLVRTFINLDTVWKVEEYKTGSVNLFLVNGKTITLFGLAANRFLLGYTSRNDVPIVLRQEVFIINDCVSQT